MKYPALHSTSFLLHAAVAFFLTLAARADIAATPEAATPLAKGAMIPDVTLKTIEGGDFSLRKETADKLTLIIFYRGGWCPYCNRHLADVQETQGELLKLGYRVLAVSPDGAAELKATVGKEHLTYTLLSDADLEATDAFGLGFSLGEDTVAKYKDYGIKLTAKREGKFVLPVPAVFLVGKDGRIGFVHYDPDYKVRLSAEDLLKAARGLVDK